MNSRESAQVAFRCLPNGEVVAVLTDAGSLLGKLPIGRQLSDLVDRESALKCERFLQSACQNGGAFNWDLNVCLRGTAHGMCFAALRGDDGRLLVVAARARATTLKLLDDALTLSAEVVSETKKSHFHLSPSWDPLHEITRVNNDLVKLQRTLVKRNVELLNLTEQNNRLLGMLAHDLRGPVAIIQGYCELLDMQGHHLLGPFQKKCVEKIQHACNMLKQLLDHALDNARATASDLSTSRSMVDVVELVRDDVEIHRIIASRKNIELCVVCDEPIPRARLDPTGIHQVISNLLTNAIKYSHRDSKVTVAIARIGAELQIAVEDRGQGIPENELGKLFEPYQVTSVQPTAGETSTGLGLSIVRDVVEAHGGHVYVESAVACGSTFLVRMPLVAASEARSDLS